MEIEMKRFPIYYFPPKMLATELVQSQELEAQPREPITEAVTCCHLLSPRVCLSRQLESGMQPGLQPRHSSGGCRCVGQQLRSSTKCPPSPPQPKCVFFKQPHAS